MWTRKFKVRSEFIGRATHGADLLAEIQEFIEARDIRVGEFRAIGVLQTARLGYYDQIAGKYVEFAPPGAPYEILSAIGNISIKDGKPFPHVHMAISDREGRTFGGHLLEGCKIFALEFFITEYEGDSLERTGDEATGLSLWPAPAWK
ncbi:MAG: DNA-binding protein [Rickettsiales bacterium]|jgi:predicted DNA-binding protein with PD1-like motif|nr:DNA-binding protein [Rickettsiales bacterium]